MDTAQAMASMSSPTMKNSRCDMPSNIERSCYGEIAQGSITGWRTRHSVAAGCSSRADDQAVGGANGQLVHRSFPGHGLA